MQNKTCGGGGVFIYCYSVCANFDSRNEAVIIADLAWVRS